MRRCQPHPRLPVWGLTKCPDNRQPFSGAPGRGIGRLARGGRRQADRAGRRRDRIKIDIINGTIDVLLSGETLAERKAAWKMPERPPLKGWLNRYSMLVHSASTGAVLTINKPTT